MIVRDARRQVADLGPCRVIHHRPSIGGGAIVVGTRGARLEDDPEYRRMLNAKRPTTRAGRRADA